MTAAPPSAAVARFAADLTALVPRAADGIIAVAVSGGPDSMAMLALAAAACPSQVIAATVDHGLRAESAAEATLVARWCADAGVPHAALHPPRDWQPRSVQADARDIRYALLGDWAVAAGAATLLTAHHADDQAETFLMRAARGSGVSGLAGIRASWAWERRRWQQGRSASDQSSPPFGLSEVEGAPRHDANVTVARPLLGWTRRELAAVVAATGMTVIQDPSNADTRFDRVRMRDHLQGDTPFDALALAASAAACAEADAALTEMMAVLLRERTRESNAAERVHDVADLPRELRRRFVRDAIGYVREVNGVSEGRWSDAANVESLLNALNAGGKATLAGVVGSADGDLWTFAAAPPRRSS
ncbi:tRNA lysidine(34) synthetase TilS [Sphingomonas sp. RS2018]